MNTAPVIDLVKRVNTLRQMMENSAMQWDESRPVFFFLEDCLSKVAAAVADELLAEQTVVCRAQLAGMRDA